jgi:chromosome segregation ATPase
MAAGWETVGTAVGGVLVATVTAIGGWRTARSSARVSETATVFAQWEKLLDEAKASSAECRELVRHCEEHREILTREVEALRVHDRQLTAEVTRLRSHDRQLTAEVTRLREQLDGVLRRERPHTGDETKLQARPFDPLQEDQQ